MSISGRRVPKQPIGGGVPTRRRHEGYRALLSGLAALMVFAGSSAAAQPARRLVVTTIDEHQTVTLAGDIRPEADTASDRGALEDGAALDHMQLLLNRPPELQAALDGFVDAQLRPGSPDFHNWLTEPQMAERFGPSTDDIAAVTSWLQGHGFRVDGVHNARMIVDFSGTAGQVREAFHAEMHHLEVRGERHIANMTDPAIPAALAGIVHGIISLNDFRPDRYVERAPNYTEGSGTYALVPGDLAVIYNIAPLFKAGISGQGQTIAVVEDTNIYKAADWTTFRKVFQLSKYTGGTLTQVNPTGSGTACGNPGVVAGAEGEAILDTEWASAAAPSAAIVVASCKDTSTTFGGLIALQNLISQSNPPALVSVSYGVCEAYTGATENAAFNTIYQQAAAIGISVFVSSGDQLATVCDRGADGATHGIAVNGWGSTPYNVSVGGTDFSDTYSGTTSTYWKATNSKAYASALSYIPEIPWNDSCASTLTSTYVGDNPAYGPSGFCNTSYGQEFGEVVGGSGGPSACATGKPAKAGIVGGTCKGYAKPSWQAVFGNPADKVRDLPDVSLFASQGPWGHYLVYCDSDTADGGAACTGAPSGWSGAGGTSFSSPIMAGIQALVNQKVGSKQGNPNPVYYALAAREYGAKGNAKCDASLGNKISKACIFRDVTLGDIDAPCVSGSPNCYAPGGTYGVLSTDPNSYVPAYATNAGWDFSTGLGSVNAANLVNGWPQ